MSLHASGGDRYDPNIRENIVAPVKALLQGKRLPEVFPPNVRDIFHYAVVKEEVGQYRILPQIEARLSTSP